MEEDQGAHVVNNVMMTEDFGEDNPLALNQDKNADENMQMLLNNLVHLGEVLQKEQAGTSGNACNVLTHFSNSVLLKGYDSWIIDTGASTHICSSMKHLKSSIISNTSVCLPDNTTKSVHSIGTVVLFDTLQLEGCLYVPSFKYNLLSVSKLAKESNIQAVFDSKCCILQDFKTSKVLAVAKEANGLYVLDSSSLSFHVNNINKMPEIDVKQVEPSIVNSLVTGFDSTLWHQRFGHPSDVVIKHMKVSDSQIGNVSDSPCLVCPIAKQSRLPFPSSTSFSAEVFHLIHLDLWGPYKTKTMSGAAYFLTIVDDCSRYTWTYLLSTKSQVFTVFKIFHKMIFIQFGKSIKTIRSDNGTEFVNVNFRDFVLQNGMLHQRSCAYTPQQNEIVEMKHKHILQVARALMMQHHCLCIFGEIIYSWPHI
ncbi:hypothetical protein LIER_07657 [Lithospermum erythrorhizon]|uniref:Integrase catalytic domain-containing protein n=1 Tax=Lithospermum erythrorhizon TaxID=34254 RepID=A0AAV3PA57_LITER